MPQNETPQNFNALAGCIKQLMSEKNKDHALDIAISTANEVLKILMPTSKNWQSLLNEGEDALEKVIPVSELPNQKSETWFKAHPFLGGERIILDLFSAPDAPLSAKFYVLNQNTAKARVSAGVHLAKKNWENSELTQNVAYKVGITFFLTPDLKRLLIVLSNRGNLRVMELSERLTNTQIEIFNKLYGVCELAPLAKDTDDAQRIIHAKLWESFALHEINKKFYDGIAEHFNLLLQHLTSKQGSNKNTEDSKLFVSRLLGRLLFVWFLRKKNIIAETQKYFSEVTELDADKYYETQLKKLFFQTLNTPIANRKITDKTTPYLNGGLFEAHKNDWVDEQVSFPPNWFETLYDHFDQFNFTTDESSPEYEQVAIDPEMLGRVFESLLATQITATGEQARKAKGAYYTPREIVAYMCKESLRQYLYTGLNNPILNAGVDSLLDKNDADFETAHTNAKRDLWGKDNSEKTALDVIALLDKIKILDPACGSGAFPMGMVQLLEKIYERLEPRFDRYKTKLTVIQKNIYGVDIEPMAVEIARLRAWLSIIVYEEDSSRIKPLPNLDFKFVCANSLVALEKSETEKGCFEYDDTTVIDELYHLITRYSILHDPKEKEKALSEHFAIKKRLTQQDKQTITSARNKQIASWNPKQDAPSDFFDPAIMFAVKDGFDVVIGNPPYVSTKGVNADDKKLFEKEYGFSDDTYNHFFFKAMKVIANNGVVTYITPKTFWTTQTKRNLRDLLLSKQIVYIFDTANPFASAMVDTCITCVKNNTSEKNKIRFYDGSQNLYEPKEYIISQKTYCDTQNSVIFKPTVDNLKIFNLYGQKVKELYDTWWDKISTSKNIAKNKVELEKYRKSLKPGDIALLGCLTEGGQGLATSNNGKYIAVRKSTKWARNIIESRPKKLKEAMVAHKIKINDLDKFSNTAEYLSSLSEKQIADLFDTLKEKYGRDIFGQGYLYRLIDDSEIADVDKLTKDEKENGIDTSMKYYVPYDKGDKDGNRWYLETPFAIAWSKENVGYLQTDTNARFQGYTYFFKEGFCWSLINGTRSENDLKFRLSASGVNDVGGMSLHSLIDLVSQKYIVCLGNSDLISRYTESFVNFTVNFQINDARQIPIIIPTQKELNDFEIIFDDAISIKKAQFSSQIFDDHAEQKLLEIQAKLNAMVNKLYGIV